MLTIEEINTQDALQLNVKGKIDSLSCDSFQNSVLRSFQRNKNVVLNMEGVEYICSAGLRTLLLGQKTAAAKGGSLVVINLSPSVRDLVRVTGFEKILTIR